MRYLNFVLLAVVVVAIAAASRGFAAELVRSPNNPASWTFQKATGADGTIKQAEGGLRIDITKAGTDNWHVQIFQDRQTVRDGADYTLTFKAKASAPRKMTITSQASDSPWRYVISPSFPAVELTTQWKDFTVPLHFQDARSDAIRLPMFLVGDVAGTVWIKDASVSTGANTGSGSYAGDYNPPAPAPAPAPAPSGELLHDPMNAASWHFENRGNAANTFRFDGEALRIEITQPNADRHAVMIFQLPQGLVEGRMYTLAITARASSPRAVSFAVTRDTVPSDAIVPDTNLNLTTDWKQYQVRFRLKKTDQQLRVPCIYAADVAGTVYIRAISLTPFSEPAK